MHSRTRYEVLAKAWSGVPQAGTPVLDSGRPRVLWQRWLPVPCDGYDGERLSVGWHLLLLGGFPFCWASSPASLRWTYGRSGRVRGERHKMATAIPAELTIGEQVLTFQNVQVTPHLHEGGGSYTDVRVYPARREDYVLALQALRTQRGVKPVVEVSIAGQQRRWGTDVTPHTDSSDRYYIDCRGMMSADECRDTQDLLAQHHLASE